MPKQSKRPNSKTPKGGGGGQNPWNQGDWNGSNVYNGGKGKGGRGNGGMTVIGAASSVTPGQEKTIRVEITNADGEGYFGQALGYCIGKDPAGRAEVKQFLKTRYPAIIQSGYTEGAPNSLAAIWGAQSALAPRHLLRPVRRLV
jgi:hypothetical protein